MDERNAIIAAVIAGWYAQSEDVRAAEISARRLQHPAASGVQLIALIVFDQVDALCMESERRMPRQVRFPIPARRPDRRG